jgi:serine/threonine-protein kinase
VRAGLLLLLVAAAAAALSARGITGWSLFLVSAGLSLPLGLLLMGRALGRVRRTLRTVEEGIASFRAQDFSRRLLEDDDDAADVAQLFNELGDVLRTQAEVGREKEALLEAVLHATPLAILLVETGGASAPRDASIAVLPFADLSTGRDQQYLCDGIAEELIHALAAISGLRVAARTSAFSFRARDMDVRRIGAALGVATVLEGSVRRDEGRIRVTAQLVEVESGYRLWAGQYDRQMGDVFALQDEITREIANKLELKLVGHRGRPFVRQHPESVEAYNLYLMGRYQWNRRTEDGFRRGIEHFQEAVSEDPSYARAFAGLADCYTQLGDYGYLPPAEARAGAKAAALEALAIDPALAEARASLAYLTLLYDWDWPAAEREFLRALELNPGYATAHQLYAEFLTATGRMEEAVAEARRAHELDPLSLIVNTVLAWVHYRARELDQAAEQCRRTVDLDPNFAVAHHLMGWIHLQGGRHGEAVRAARRSVELSGRSSLMTASLGHALAVSGEPDEARKLLEELMRRKRRGYVPPYDIALVHAGLGEAREALEWLNEAHEERYGWLVYLQADPIWDVLRPEPGFGALVRRIGLPE